MEPIVAQQIGELALKGIAIAWRQQGHELTGQAVRDMEIRVEQTAKGYRIDGYLNDYMAYLNTGIPASRIPYTRGSGAARSQYIAGLERYANHRMGASDREALAIAFAIASKHKREGMPTRASARFSSTGRRTGFVDEALDTLVDEFDALILQGVEAAFNLYFDNFIKTILNR
jgi:hypothetical protein